MDDPFGAIWHQDLEPHEAVLVAAKASAIQTILARQNMTMSCHLASRLWARVFITHDMPVTFTQGFYQDGDEMVGHTWLELASGSIFDPTSAQFDNPGDPDCYTITDCDELDNLEDLAQIDL
jgi:hypothetical protein